MLWMLFQALFLYGGAGAAITLACIAVACVIWRAVGNRPLPPCDHTRYGRVDGTGHNCPDCGAYMGVYDP